MSASREFKGRQTNPLSMIFKSISTVLAELMEGTAESGGWVLNRSDKGLLKSLDQLSSREASAMPTDGGSSIAAHVDHLRYGLSLLNQWSAGEKNPFADADYSASWARTTVSETDWKVLRDRLCEEVHRWHAALGMPRELNEMELNGIVASVAHMAYHLGAIRQIDRKTRGPSASD